MADADAVREAVCRAEEHLRELYNTDDDWLRAMRTAYAEFKAHAAATWLHGLTHADALRNAVKLLWDANGGTWDFVPSLERLGADSMCQLLADCADLNKCPWDKDAGKYYPDYDTNRVEVYLEPEDDGQDADDGAQGSWVQEQP
jgi:hypothetical protein